MKNSYKLAFAAIVFVFAIPDQVSAQITITYDAGFPKAGTNKGDIDVSGNLTIPAGTAGATTGVGRIILSPAGGGLKQTVSITVPANATGKVQWSGTASMLAGPKYNVKVEIEVKILNQFPVYETNTVQTVPK